MKASSEQKTKLYLNLEPTNSTPGDGARVESSEGIDMNAWNLDIVPQRLTRKNRSPLVVRPTGKNLSLPDRIHGATRRWRFTPRRLSWPHRRR